MRRVAITGLGAICALGKNTAETWRSLTAGESAIAEIESLDTSRLRFRKGAEIRNFDAKDYFQGAQADALDRFAQFAVIAAREAVHDSGIELTAELSGRTAVVTGSCVGGQTSQDAGFVELYRHDSNRVHPLTIPRTMANAGASHICTEFGITGPTMTISTACSSANHALGEALWMVRSGRADRALAGGSEAPFSFGILKAWEAMRVVAPDTCRPFSKDRRGLILGEGAAMLVLEPLDSALRRGAKLYAEFAGFGMSADAYHLTQPKMGGPAQAMRSALEDGRIQPEEVGYINAHGTGTPSNDCVEAQAIRASFGPHSPKIWVSSTKSMHGHALGAAGAIEAIATVLALQKGVIPPTANFTELDPQCQINVVANQSLRAEVECALSNSFAFGGLNAVLAFRRLQVSR